MRHHSHDIDGMPLQHSTPMTHPSHPPQSSSSLPLHLQPCALCGSQLILAQLNLTHAVYVCQESQCPYPLNTPHVDSFLIANPILAIPPTLASFDNMKHDERKICSSESKSSTVTRTTSISFLSSSSSAANTSTTIPVRSADSALAAMKRSNIKSVTLNASMRASSSHSAASSSSAAASSTSSSIALAPLASSSTSLPSIASPTSDVSSTLAHLQLYSSPPPTSSTTMTHDAQPAFTSPGLHSMSASYQSQQQHDYQSHQFLSPSLYGQTNSSLDSESAPLFFDDMLLPQQAHQNDGDIIWE